MSVYISPIGGAAAQFFDNDGNTLSGGKIFTYISGTNTPQTTYTTIAGTIAHPNPIILDSAGRVPSGEIWLDVSRVYKFVIKTNADTLIGTYDNIIGPSTIVYSQNDFVGDGSTATFTLTTAPASKDVTFVYINGIYQNKNTYSLSGTSLVFTQAPPSNSTIEVMYAQATQDIGLNNFAGNGSTTIFTLTNAPFSENSTFVFINGVYQQKNTYTVVGTTLTFSTAPPINTSIEVVYT
jgi:hypothetical protein